MKIRFLLLVFCTMLMFSSYAQLPPEDDQGSRVISTAVPFLTITPDARAGGMAESGVSSTADEYSIFWNPAKYAFIDKSFGVGISYIPWLRNLVNDMGLASAVGYFKIGDKQAVALSMRFFSVGTVELTDDQGTSQGQYKPYDLAVDATYSRKFSREFSGAVAGRFIYSNLVPMPDNNTSSGSKGGTSVAADVAIYYHHLMEIKGLTGASLDFGLNISNIGSKISYSNAKTASDFIPATLRLGPSFTMDLDEYNRVAISLDLSKLLLPTPPIYWKDYKGQDSIFVDNTKHVQYGMESKNLSPVSAMIQSFYDAPYGFKEEIQEVMVSVAAEYWYNKLFSVRAGYFYESKYKGNRQFFTMGAGLRYNVFGLDFSYLLPVKSNNPLQNTLQFTLLFNFNAGKKSAAPDKNSGGTN